MLSGIVLNMEVQTWMYRCLARQAWLESLDQTFVDQVVMIKMELIQQKGTTGGMTHKFQLLMGMRHSTNTNSHAMQHCGDFDIQRPTSDIYNKQWEEAKRPPNPVAGAHQRSERRKRLPSSRQEGHGGGGGEVDIYWLVAFEGQIRSGNVPGLSQLGILNPERETKTEDAETRAGFPKPCQLGNPYRGSEFKGRPSPPPSQVVTKDTLYLAGTFFMDLPVLDGMELICWKMKSLPFPATNANVAITQVTHLFQT